MEEAHGNIFMHRCSFLRLQRHRSAGSRHLSPYNWCKKWWWCNFIGLSDIIFSRVGVSHRGVAISECYDSVRRLLWEWSHDEEQGFDKGEDGFVGNDCYEAQLFVLSCTVLVLDGGRQRMEGVRFGVDGQNSVFFLLLSHMFLLMLVIQTVMYFVCKS